MQGGAVFSLEGFAVRFPISSLYCKMLQSKANEHLQMERTMGAKDRARILAFLRQHKSEMQSQFGVTRLGLVGSCARDEDARIVWDAVQKELPILKTEIIRLRSVV